MLFYQVINQQYHTIKQLLLQYFQISHRLLIKLKKYKRIHLNGIPTYIDKTLSIGDIVTIYIDFDEISENIVPTQMSLNIVYEDTELLILNKSYGIPVHPSVSHFNDSLSNGVQFYFSMQQLQRKIRPVNRLDKDTSGLIIFAKNEYVQELLIRQMKDKTFEKRYLALLEGFLTNASGTIDAPIVRKKDSIIEREISTQGATAITHYTLLKKLELPNNGNHQNSIRSLSLVEFRLETGRTHQIRVHSSFLGHPILGDTLYGNASPDICRQALHAYKISFIHPFTKEHMMFSIPLPEDMKTVIRHSKIK